MMLYKYYPINTNTINAISGRGLWCHYPNKMNDPFECLHIIDRNFSSKSLGDFRSFSQKSSSQHLKKLSKLNDEELSSFFNKARRNKIEKYAFCSLSEDPFNILMWSHYADSHRGISVGFEFKEQSNDWVFQKITYLDRLKDYDLLAWAKFMDGDDSLLGYVLGDLSIKSAEWEKEREWRIWRNSPFYYRYSDAEIKEVNFGINCTEETKRIVEKLLPEGGVIFYEMETSTDPFRLIR